MLAIRQQHKGQAPSDALVPALSRTLRLTLLAPDIIEAILGGRTDQSLTLERLERPQPARWEEQCPFLPRRRVDH